MHRSGRIERAQQLASSSSRSADRPASRSVGTSGTSGERVSPDTARMRILPALCCGTVTAKSAVNIITWPPMRSVIAAGPLLYGMGFILMPAMLDSAAVIANAVRLAKLAALLQVPAFLTEQNPAGLGETLPEIRNAFDVPPRVLAKMQFSAVEEGLGEACTLDIRLVDRIAPAPGAHKVPQVVSRMGNPA